MRSAVIIGHQNTPECEVVATALSRHQISTTIIDRCDGTLGPSCLIADLTVHLGSDLSVASGKMPPKIQSEYELMMARYKQGRAVLGVCFGAQMMALVLGGTVVRSEFPEFGFVEVRSVDHPNIFGGRWFQWHYDMVEIPANVDVIALNEKAIQAFRKDHFLGVQFHPEVDVRVLKSWLRNGGREELASLSIDSNCLLTDLKTSQRKSEQRFESFVQFVLQELLSVQQ